MTKQTVPGTGRLDGKVAFLAGATGGIGRTAAEQFAREGARVAADGRRWREGQEVADAIAAKGAVLTLTRSTAREYVRDRVRVNAIAPASVRTDRIMKLLEESPGARAAMEGQALGSSSRSRSPTRRCSSPPTSRGA